MKHFPPLLALNLRLFFVLLLLSFLEMMWLSWQRFSLLLFCLEFWGGLASSNDLTSCQLDIDFNTLCSSRSGEKRAIQKQPLTLAPSLEPFFIISRSLSRKCLQPEAIRHTHGSKKLTSAGNGTFE